VPVFPIEVNGKILSSNHEIISVIEIGIRTFFCDRAYRRMPGEYGLCAKLALIYVNMGLSI